MRITNLEFQLISPPDGNSSILEVSDHDGNDFLHVIASSPQEYEFKILSNSNELILTLEQIKNIIEVSKKNLVYVDYD